MDNQGIIERNQAMRIPFGEPNYSELEIEAVARIMRSKWTGPGPETESFEAELAESLGAQHVVLVSSCTDALFLSLLVSGVGPGDEVICPSLTWCGDANVICHLGARPIFCDIEEASLSVTGETVSAKLSCRTKAVLVVHYGGRACDIADIRRVLPDQVCLVEDAAHSLGSLYADGRTVGSSNNLTCFSFYANKVLSTVNGGAIALPDAGIADRLRILRQDGVSQSAYQRQKESGEGVVPKVVEVGYKASYSDLQAAMGRVQLARQSEFAERRLDVARTYVKKLGPVFGRDAFHDRILDAGHARHLFPFKLFPKTSARHRDALLRELRASGLGVGVHYPPLHKMPLYSPVPSSLPVTEAVFERLMSLPMSASMTASDAEDCSEALLSFQKREPAQ